MAQPVFSLKSVEVNDNVDQNDVNTMIVGPLQVEDD